MKCSVLKLCSGCFKAFLWFLFLFYIVVPSFLYVYPEFFRKFVFFTVLYCPYRTNFTNLEQFRLAENNTRNFYVTNPQSSIKLGFWQILPKSDVASASVLPDDAYFESKLNNGKPIILYLHGNAMNRGGYHRVQMYKLLAERGYHVVTFDYRGYGDSEGTPTCEQDLLSDAVTALRFVREKAPNAPLIIWGHSLGTGVTGILMRHLESIEADGKHDLFPLGIVLETPFTTLREVGKTHLFSTFHRWTPYFETVFLDGPGHAGLHFETERNLETFKKPILILHAEDDHIVPFALGNRLYEHLRSKGRHVQFVRFDAGKGYYHKHIWMAPELPEIVRNFVDQLVK